MKLPAMSLLPLLLPALLLVHANKAEVTSGDAAQALEIMRNGSRGFGCGSRLASEREALMSDDPHRRLTQRHSGSDNRVGRPSMNGFAQGTS